MNEQIEVEAVICRDERYRREPNKDGMAWDGFACYSLNTRTDFWSLAESMNTLRFCVYSAPPKIYDYLLC